MMIGKNQLLGALFGAGTALVPMAASAQSIIYPAHITEVSTGWSSDDVGVAIDQPFVNPANCTSHDYYMSMGGTPGNRTFLAAALTALANKLPVSIVVSNTQCAANGRPMLMAVSPSAPQ